MSKIEPTSIPLPPVRPHAHYAELLEAAAGEGESARKAATNARCASAAIWSYELMWADTVVARRGWSASELETLIARLRERHRETWGIHSDCD